MGGGARVRAGVLVAAAALLFGGLPPSAEATWDSTPMGGVVTARHGLCSPSDLPETGIQGDVPMADQRSGRAERGYNCGLSLVGHTVIQKAPGADPTRRGGNANMAWAGDCAYVSGPGALFGPPSPRGDWGVAVIDASDPTAPEHVTTLRTPGALATSETLHAVEAPGRSVLVVGQYGNVGSTNVPMDVYDVSDCARPRLLQTFRWPENTHNLTVSANGRYVFGTQPLQVADLDPLFDADPATGIRFVGNLEAALPMPIVAHGPGADLDDALPKAVRELRKSGGTSLSHEAWPSPDGTKLYLGGVTPLFEVFTIVDITRWLSRSGPPEVISQRSGRGHSVRTATIRTGDDVQRLVLHSEEAVFGTAFGCFPETLNPFAGPAQPWLTDITDEGEPELLSQFGLEINDPEHCLDQLQSGVNSSSHYHDVDDPDDSSFAMVSMWNAGVRIFDIRDPERPVEVAYFNPGDVASGPQVLLDVAWGHIRYRPETGQLWFATDTGGFWIVELGQRVRDHFAVDPAVPAPVHPRGFPGSRGTPLLEGVQIRIELSGLYCTLGSTLPRLPT